MIGCLNHVAIAVPDLNEAALKYQQTLGAEVSEQQELVDHGVKVVFVKLANTKIELLHP
ncbi:MAG: VOC family protein, partial [Pseudomonadota bacterium]|nr:VOC family protein [Pseudomonadota bacterium]